MEEHSSRMSRLAVSRDGHIDEYNGLDVHVVVVLKLDALRFVCCEPFLKLLNSSFGGVLALNVRIYYPPFVRIYPPYQDILSLLSTKYDTYILMLWVIL